MADLCNRADVACFSKESGSCALIFKENVKKRIAKAQKLFQTLMVSIIFNNLAAERITL